MKASRWTWITLALAATSGIPLYGLFSGHLAEMMGGRMMVWGIAWMLLILVEMAVFLCIGVIAIVRWQRGSPSR